MLRWVLVVFVTTAVSSSLCFSQTSYRLPPQKVVDIVDSAPPPGLDISVDGSWILLTDRDAIDAALLYETESQLDQSLYYLIGNSYVRVVVIDANEQVGTRC